MAKPIKGIPSHIQEYIICLLLHLFLPLLPIIIRFSQSGIPDDQTLTMATSMYAITIGLSSRSKLFFVIGFLICLIFAIAYGISTNSHDTFSNTGIMALVAILSILLVHALERYNIHVVERFPYLDFLK